MLRQATKPSGRTSRAPRTRCRVRPPRPGGERHAEAVGVHRHLGGWPRPRPPCPSTPASSTNLRPYGSRVERWRWWRVTCRWGARAPGWPGSAAGTGGRGSLSVLRPQRPSCGTGAQRDGAVVDHLWTLPARHDEGAGTGGKVLADQHADVLRQVVAWLTQGADGGRGQPGRRCPLRPTQSRPGWRAATATASRPGHPGRLDRAAIPRLRSGSYLPSFLEPRRSEQALVAVVQEATSTGSRPQGRPAGRGAGAGRDVHRSGVTALPRPG